MTSALMTIHLWNHILQFPVALTSLKSHFGVHLHVWCDLRWQAHPVLWNIIKIMIMHALHQALESLNNSTQSGVEFLQWLKGGVKLIHSSAWAQACVMGMDWQQEQQQTISKIMATAQSIKKGLDSNKDFLRKFVLVYYWLFHCLASVLLLFWQRK